ncbi:MAG: VWA domain-containing protein [Acidobacteriota bacterium]
MNRRAERAMEHRAGRAMNHRAGLVRAVLALLGMMATLGAAADQPVVMLVSPAPGEPVFGEVEMIADVVSETPLERVIFRVDGVVVAELTEPPYRLRVGLGDSGVEHRFEVVAENVEGEVGRSLLISPRFAIDDAVELELQQLYVTVSRRQDRVLDLTAGDFEVLDNGARQKLVTFERGDVPLTALLLVDASDSMRGERLQAAVAGAAAFIDGMAELDQAKLLLFAERVLHDSPFTSFAEVLQTGLEGVEARGSTALNDHLYLALRLLEPRQGRRVIILLSDGIDVASVLRMRELLPSVRRSQALIYWLRLGQAAADHVSAWRGIEEHREEFELLERAVEDSGGRVLILPDITQTRAAFHDILDELRDQYVLGYYPSVNRGDGSWHEIKVKLRDRALSVRTRQGYVDLR